MAVARYLYQLAQSQNLDPGEMLEGYGLLKNPPYNRWAQYTSVYELLRAFRFGKNLQLESFEQEKLSYHLSVGYGF